MNMRKWDAIYKTYSKPVLIKGRRKNNGGVHLVLFDRYWTMTTRFKVTVVFWLAILTAAVTGLIIGKI